MARFFAFGFGLVLVLPNVDLGLASFTLQPPARREIPLQFRVRSGGFHSVVTRREALRMRIKPTSALKAFCFFILAAYPPPR